MKEAIWCKSSEWGRKLGNGCHRNGILVYTRKNTQKPYRNPCRDHSRRRAVCAVSYGAVVGGLSGLEDLKASSRIQKHSMLGGINCERKTGFSWCCLPIVKMGPMSLLPSEGRQCMTSALHRDSRCDQNWAAGSPSGWMQLPCTPSTQASTGPAFTRADDNWEHGVPSISWAQSKMLKGCSAKCHSCRTSATSLLSPCQGAGQGLSQPQ